VTAFDEFAIRAFDVHALDYLVKPFSDARFEFTLARARRRLVEMDAPRLAAELRALLDARPRAHEGPASLERFADGTELPVSRRRRELLLLRLGHERARGP
jgi:two-component system, LytTR family, response regulator